MKPIYKQPKTLTFFGYLSLFIVLLGFFLLSFPKIEDYFGKHLWVFYSLFFGPICIFIIVSSLACVIGIIIGLINEYKKLRSEGKTFPIAFFEILKIIGYLLLLIAAFYLNYFWSFKKR